MEEEWDLIFKMENLNIKYTLDCGQCFRWRKTFENSNDTYEYIGVLQDRVIKIRQEKNNFYVSSNNKDMLKEAVYNYFDLYNNYEMIEKRISKIDSNIATSLKYSTGLHILNQPVFETMISYIISANNNIKRISGSVEKISMMFGKKIEFEGNDYYLFPTLKELELAVNENMLCCGTGFRARYIIHNIKRLLENDDLLHSYNQMDSETLRKELLTYMGIGTKVADCIMLFSMKRGERFPIDVWVKRVMEKLYMRENTSIKEIEEYAKEKFNGDAGIIQQHLFYNIREGNI